MFLSNNWESKSLRINLRLIALLILSVTFATFVLVEVYAHSYVRTLPVISEQEAFDFVPNLSNGSN